ncbi:hypothetical protein ACWCXH_00695 [Kitasatospora sp. NPDC001660]
MDHGLGVRLDRPFPQTVEAVTAALKEQGFGVLTTIDVRATRRAKPGGVADGAVRRLTAAPDPLRD